MKLLVTYIRWSTKEQDKGDSLKRQSKLIDDFFTKHRSEFHLSSSHRYVDKGKSGFHQMHKVGGGEFKRMYDNVMNGEIPSGSLIIVENFDRLSRANVDDAMEDVRQILRKGVDIKTLGDGGELYNKASLSDPYRLIKQILNADRAHSESLRKQEFSRKVWSAKTQMAVENKKPLGKQASGWLELSEDRTKYHVIKKKAEIVSLIFEKRLAGMSMFAITKWLNENNIPTINDRKIRISKTPKPFGGNWSSLSVKCVLKSRSVIGYLPAKISTEDRKTVLREEIPNYYPRIISDQTFYAVQQLLADTGKGKTTSGHHWLYVNIFRTIIRCKCGLVMTPTGIRKPVYQGSYRCKGVSEGRCDYGSASRKLVDIELCTRVFAKLSQLYDDNIDEDKLNSLNVDLSTVNTQLLTLAQTLLMSPDIIQVQNLLTERQKVKDDILFKIKQEKSRIESVCDLDLSQLDMESVNGRTEAQIIIKKMVKEIIVNGRDKIVDIYLQNGNVINNFPLSGHANHVGTLVEATDEEKNREVFSILGRSVPVIYSAGESDGINPPDYSNWPDAEDMDYPHENNE